MSRKLLATTLALLVVASLVLSACGTPTPVATEAPAEVVATEAPAPAIEEKPTEAAPTEAPAAPATTRKGAWLDEIVFSVVAG